MLIATRDLGFLVVISVILIAMDPLYPQNTPEPQNVHELLNLYSQKQSSAPSKKTIYLMFGGALLLLVAIFFVFFGSRKDTGKASIESVLSAQQKILTTADQADQGVRSRTTLNYVTRVQAVVASDQTSVLSTFASKKISKSYKTAKDTTGLAKIQQASQSNQYDDIVTAVLKDEIVDYQTKLKEAYDATKSTKTKTALSDSYKHSSSLQP